MLVFPSAGHGAWEAAFVNTCSPGDRVLMAETGAFAQWWKELAEGFGLRVDYLAGDWRHGADPAALEAALRDDRAREIRAVAIVHNETSTGIVSRLAEIRRAIDAADHPALLIVDTISSLASMDFRMDEWRVDVAVGGSQKGLMLPPGLSFNAVSAKALAASQSARLPRAYWDWRPMLPKGRDMDFTCTPAVNLFFGLKEALAMVGEEGLDAVFERHRRLAEAVRRAVAAWGADGGIELQSLHPAEHSNSVSAIRLPEGHDAEAVRGIARERFDTVLGAGLLRLRGRAFRIGHLGDLNAPMILGALAAAEMALRANGVPHRPGGVQAALDCLAEPPAKGTAP